MPLLVVEKASDGMSAVRSRRPARVQCENVHVRHSPVYQQAATNWSACLGHERMVHVLLLFPGYVSEETIDGRAGAV